jgi:hypothetical protein
MKSTDLMWEDFESLPYWGKVKYFWLFLTWAIVLEIGQRVGKPHWWNGGRRTDGDPTVCKSCLYVCRVRDCVHGYQSDGLGDVEGVDECPRCGSTAI